MNKLKTMVVYRLLPVGVIASSALMAASAHAQVTFSATAPQQALQTIADGSTNFFYANAPGVLLIGIAVGIVMGLAGWLIRRLMARRSV